MAVENPPTFVASGGESAEQCRRAVSGWGDHGAATGIASTVPNSGVLKVTQNGTPNMTVNIAIGGIWVPGTQATTQGNYYCFNPSILNLPITTADPSNPRIDVIAAVVQDAQYSGLNNQWLLQDVTGTPNPSPSVPALPANAIALAQVAVAANASSVVNANITDKRIYATTTTPGAISLFGSTTPLVGSLPTPLSGSPFLLQAWAGSASSNGFGGFGINFPSVFPNGVLYVDTHLTFPGTNPGWVLKQKGWTTAGVTGVLDTFTSSGLVTSTTFTYNGFAIGW